MNDVSTRINFVLASWTIGFVGALCAGYLSRPDQAEAPPRPVTTATTATIGADEKGDYTIFVFQANKPIMTHRADYLKVVQKSTVSR